MSVAHRDLQAVHGLAKRLRRPDLDSAVVVVEQQKIEGHFYNNPTVIAIDQARATVGDLGITMATHRRTSNDLDSRNTLTPPVSELGAPDTDPRTMTASDEAPEGYRARAPGWFTPGRFFRIWARDVENVDMELHDKDFILLATKNIDGPALLVRRHDREECNTHRGHFHRSHVLIQNIHNTPPDIQPSRSGDHRRPHPPRKVVYMDEEEDLVAENTYVELEHSYNIPFGKFKCIDYGVLDRPSLRELRKYYVGWLKYEWDLN